MPVSLVSHYGKKPESLTHLLTQLQGTLTAHFGDAFHPYTIVQIHSTIIGMETIAKDHELYSRWCVENEDRWLPIDRVQLQVFLERDLPSFSILIGGYQENKNYGFYSRKESPYVRSFSILGNRVVLNGWPVSKQVSSYQPSQALQDLRNQFKQFNVCHKWNQDGYEDNDFFMVLGKIDESQTVKEKIEIVLNAMRLQLSKEAVIFTVDYHSLFLAVYENPELTPQTTQLIKLTDKNWQLSF